MPTETLETKEGEVEDLIEMMENIIKWLDAKEEEQNKLQVCRCIICLIF